MKRNKVSVITVVKDPKREDFLRTMNSVVMQTYKNLEYIVKIHKNDPVAKSILESYPHTDKMKILSTDDVHLYDAMNQGREQASGSHVIFLNSGDYFIERDTIRRAMQEVSCADVIYYSDYVCKGDLRVIEPLTGMKYRSTLRHEATIVPKYLYDENPFWLSGYTSEDFRFFRKMYYSDIVFKKLSVPLTDILPLGVSDRNRISVISEWQDIAAIEGIEMVLYTYWRLVERLKRSAKFFMGIPY